MFRNLSIASNRMSRICAFALLGYLLTGAQPAHAQGPVLPAILPDFAPANEAIREESAAVGLLVRSMLKPLKRQFVSRRELALALDAIGIKNRRDLSVPGGTATALIEKLLVDRVVLGQIGFANGRLVMSGQVLNNKGETLTSITAYAPAGAVHNLAEQIARQISTVLECSFEAIEPTSMRHLRSFAAASDAEASGDIVGAAKAFALAPSGLGTKVTAIKELAQAVWSHPQTPSDQKISVALTVGEFEIARTLADKELKEHPQNIVVRAARARALVGMNDFRGAERELTAMQANMAEPDVAIAAADLAIAKGASRGERDAAFQALTDASTERWAKPLAFMAGTPPNAFSNTVEALAVSRAKEFQPTNPSLASAIGFRAVAGDVDGQRAVAMIRADDLGMADIAAILDKVEKLALAGSQQANILKLEMGRRTELAADLRLEAIGATDPAAHISLIASLHPLLERFEALSKREFSSVTLLPMAGSGEPFYSPYKVNEDVLRIGLGAALAGKPYEIAVRPAPPGQEPIRGTQLSEDGLANLAAGAYAEGLVLYKIRPSGSSAQITLMLVDTETRRAWTSEETIEGKLNGLLTVNPTPWIVLTVIILLAAAFLARRVLSGSIVVHIKEMPEADEQLFNIRITRTPTGPTVGPPTNFIERMRRTPPKQTADEATRVGARTTFPGIARGKYFVHLFGTYKRGGDVVVVDGESFSREVQVQAGKKAAAQFSMEATHAQFVVTVMDGEKPVAGAVVWIDQDEATRWRTSVDGKATFDVPRGRRTISILADGLTIRRPFEILQTKQHDLPINLEWERKREGVSRVLERPPSNRGSNEGAGDASAYATSPNRPANANPFASNPPSSMGQNPFASAPPSGARQNPFAATPSTSGGVQAFVPRSEVVAGFNMPQLPNNQPGPQAGAPTGVGMSMAAGPATAAATPSAIRQPGLGITPEELTPVPEVSGTKLERYQRTGKLGAGAMGVVYKALDVVLDREVALKIMSPDIRDNPEIAAKFTLEAKSLAALNHPNIVTVYDYGSAAGELFMVMEMVEGPGALDAILENRTKLTPEEAVDVIDQLCRAIGYAHKRRIIHRDIKPANMFLTHDGMVKVGDFGLARAIGAMKITKTVVQGTPLYMSPEQILGRDVDFRADLYSIGCTFFECLTGQPPFIEGEVLYHHMHTAPPKVSSLVPGLPKVLDDLIDRCLVKDKDQRIGSAEDIRAGLRAVRAALD